MSRSGKDHPRKKRYPSGTENIYNVEVCPICEMQIYDENAVIDKKGRLCHRECIESEETE